MVLQKLETGINTPHLLCSSTPFQADQNFKLITGLISDIDLYCITNWQVISSKVAKCKQINNFTPAFCNHRHTGTDYLLTCKFSSQTLMSESFTGNKPFFNRIVYLTDNKWDIGHCLKCLYTKTIIWLLFTIYMKYISKVTLISRNLTQKQ